MWSVVGDWFLVATARAISGLYLVLAILCVLACWPS